jgi:hypothetical protein
VAGFRVSGENMVRSPPEAQLRREVRENGHLSSSQNFQRKLQLNLAR